MQDAFLSAWTGKLGRIKAMMDDAEYMHILEENLFRLLEI